METEELTTDIRQLIKENFIKFDDQMKVYQIVREALLEYEKILKRKIKTEAFRNHVNVFGDEQYKGVSLKDLDKILEDSK